MFLVYFYPRFDYDYDVSTWYFDAVLDWWPPDKASEAIFGFILPII